MQTIITTFNALPATGLLVLLALSLLIRRLHRRYDCERQCQAQDLHGPHNLIKAHRGQA